MTGLLKRQTFNDTLALIIFGGYIALWVLSVWKPVPQIVLGATIAHTGQIVTFYYRKAKNGNGEAKP